MTSRARTSAMSTRKYALRKTHAGMDILSVKHLWITPTKVAFLAPPAVDDAWPLSVAVARINAKDTTCESAPEQWSWNSARGPRRPKGHDRLMDKVQPTSDASPAICPICGSPPSARSTRISGGVVIGDYRDSAGHIWSTHWMAVA